MYLQKLITEKKIKNWITFFKFQVPTGGSLYQKYTFVDRSFGVHGQKLWNALPNSIKEIKQMTHLRENLKHICSQKLTPKKH